MSIKTAAEKVARLKKQFSADICSVNQFYYPKAICKNQPPETTNLMKSCLSCPLRETCKILFVEGR